MARRILVLLAMLLLVSSAGLAIADTRGSPELSVFLPDGRLEPGETATVELYLQNAGDIEEGGTAAQEARVTTARDVRVTLTNGSAPLRVETTTRPVGNVPEGLAGPVDFAVTVAEDAIPGTYELPVTVAYAYTREIETDDPSGPDHHTDTETLRTSVDVVVEERPRFLVEDAEAAVAVGGTGDLAVTLRNTADVPARGASVRLRSNDPALTFGGASAATTFVGDWGAGEVRRVTVSAAVASGVDVRTLPVTVEVTYTDVDGDDRSNDPVTTGVTPRAEQSFAVDEVRSTLAVGDRGTLRGRLRNTGDVRVRNAVVRLTTENENVVPIETEYAVGDLAPGDTATFAFDAEVSDAADAGPRQLSVTIRYRDADDDVRRSDPVDVRVDVGPRRDVFAVEPVEATYQAGSAGILELRVTNAGDEPVSEVRAKLFTDDPLSSADDEAFVDTLAPGESTSLRFELSTAPDALGKVYPVSMDFQYEDGDGDTRLSNTYEVPVTVTERSSGSGLDPLLVGVVLVGALVIVGLVVARRLG